MVAIVYAAKSDNDPIWKIGRTKTRAKRLKTHRGSNPSFTNRREFETESPEMVETFVRRFLASKRVMGTTEWFSVTEQEIDQVFAEAAIYRDNVLPLQKQVHRLKTKTSIGEPLPADTSASKKHERLKEIEEHLSRLEYEQESLMLELMTQIGDHKGIDGLVSWKSHSVESLDTVRFKKECPDLYAKYHDKVATKRVFKLL